MTFKLKVRSDTDDDFILLIDADAANTFLQLHEVLQEECGFNPLQLVTFFSADEEWDKDMEIRMFPNAFSLDASFNGMIMRNTRLDEFLSKEEDKLLYTFDIQNDKSLYIELSGISDEEIQKAPVVMLRKGNAPEQSPQGISERLPGESLERELLNTWDDLGELEDLYEIYGEMTDHVL